MAVCFDQGSESFWVLEPGAVYNWGSERIGQPGACNTTAGPVYDYSASSDATEPVSFDFFNAYGGFSKVIIGNVTFEDTMTFTSVSGQRSTIPGVGSALANFISVRSPDFSNKCEVPDDLEYDVGILGTAPYRTNPDASRPHLRQQLLSQGAIKAAVQSMWMDKRPAGVKDTYTGGALFGGVDLSKFTGPLVKVRSRKNDADTAGYYVAQPTFSVGGKAIKTTTSSGEQQWCFVDSGTRNDALPVSYDDAGSFYAATGLVESPAGHVSWPGSCDSVPADVTIDMRFRGTTGNGTSSVDIRAPLRNYLRWDSGEAGLCRLNIYIGGGCTLAAPFASAAFFAADDERGEIALAQGGVSERGSGPEAKAIVERIP